MKISTFVGAALAAAGLAACGDPLFTAQDRGDAVLNLQGQALSQSGPQSSSGFEVGVLFVRYSNDGPDPGEGTLETEIVKGTLTGDFPTQFQVQLTPPQAAYPVTGDIVYMNMDGTESFGIFSAEHSPGGVRIGHLLVGPAAELDALPAKIRYSLGGSRSIGPTLAPYLPTTTITGYQVIYAEDVRKGDVIYPTLLPRTGPDYNFRVSGGTQIKDGYTLVDSRSYLTSVIWQECVNGLGAGHAERPDYQACLQANSELISCSGACYGRPDERRMCEAACRASFPGQIDSRACVWQVLQPQIDATCGPEKTPHPDQIRVLAEGDSLSVTLGADDVKGGMWLLHLSEGDGVLISGGSRPGHFE
jgi:hypothetical protein